MSTKIIKRSSAEMYKQHMVKYAIIVDRKRALPEKKDGLKPIQRKVLYDVFELGAINHTIKSARITGDVMGKYSPHSDSGTYVAMQVLANWFSSKIPLLDGQGNWGNCTGDGAAAQRYTEAKLSEFAYDCIISELKENKSIVNWVPNYDRTTKEPEYLPCKVPLLLINGSFGIGVGMSVNTPSFNLVEVLEATRRLLYDSNYDPILIPDHCQPLKLIDTDWAEICHTGLGRYKVRGLIKVTTKNDIPTIHINSLPDNVSSSNVVAKILKLIEKKQLPMVKDVIDASLKEEGKREILDVQVILKKGSDVNYVKEILYNKCGVQDTVRVELLVVDDINPRRFTFKEYLMDFIEHRITTKFRMYCNKHSIADTKRHKLETFISFIESGLMDKIIKFIQQQTTTNNNVLSEAIISKFKITDLQANFIITTPLSKLTKGNLKIYKSEYANLLKEIKFYKSMIVDDGTNIIKEIDKELIEIEKKYGSPRICNVVKMSVENNVPAGTFIIVITEKNYIRKLAINEPVKSIRGDNPKIIMQVDNTESILLFDNLGKVFKLPVSRISLVDRNNIGIDIRTMIRNLTSNIVNAYYEPDILKLIKDKRHKFFITTVTKNNIIKNMELSDFINVNVSGLIYTKLKDDDEVVGVSVIEASQDIVVFSGNKALRFNVNTIPVFKRNSVGSKAMNNAEHIEGLSVSNPNSNCAVVVTNSGRINKITITSLPLKARGRSGLNVIKLQKNDSIKRIFLANDRSVVRMYTSDGIFDINVSDIKLKSSVATGDRMIKGQFIDADLIQ